MDRSRWISLAIVVLYVAAHILAAVLTDSPAGEPKIERFAAGRAGFTLLFLGFVCIWWGDILGPGSVGMKFGLVSEPTSGAAMRVLGWIFLILAVAIPIVDFLCGD